MLLFPVLSFCLLFLFYPFDPQQLVIYPLDLHQLVISPLRQKLQQLVVYPL
jgi:hypothetical protein